jgi:hypothetical protein
MWRNILTKSLAVPKRAPALCAPPSIQRRTITGVFALSAAASLHADSILRVDFGAINDLELGFSVWNIGADGVGPRGTSFTVSDLSAVPTCTVKATLDAGTDPTNLANNTGTLNTRLRGMPVNHGAFTYALLLRDRVVGLGATGSSLFPCRQRLCPSKGDRCLMFARSLGVGSR